MDSKRCHTKRSGGGILKNFKHSKMKRGLETVRAKVPPLNLQNHGFLSHGHRRFSPRNIISTSRDEKTSAWKDVDSIAKIRPRGNSACPKQKALLSLSCKDLEVGSCLTTVLEHSNNDQDQYHPKNDSFSSPSFGDRHTPNLPHGMDPNDTPGTIEMSSNLSENMKGRTCTICYVNLANTVFMPCGHGEICEKCSLDVWIKNGKCPFCRDPISQC
jgi:hypothetical protein